MGRTKETGNRKQETKNQTRRGEPQNYEHDNCQLARLPAPSAQWQYRAVAMPVAKSAAAAATAAATGTATAAWQIQIKLMCDQLHPILTALPRQTSSSMARCRLHFSGNSDAWPSSTIGSSIRMESNSFRQPNSTGSSASPAMLPSALISSKL